MQHAIAARDIDDWVQLVRAEYAEMPGLHLSMRQAQRLWNLDGAAAEAIFDTLESAHFLRRLEDDRYVRADVDRR
jgi:hypothetical protein